MIEMGQRGAAGTDAVRLIGSDRESALALQGDCPQGPARGLRLGQIGDMSVITFELDIFHNVQ